jgi:sulfotransferase family protein
MSTPVFVGGAPRSGTHIVAHLVGAHPRYSVIPYEVTAHCDRRGGIPAYLAGTLDRAALIEKMRTLWWRRPLPWDEKLERGLFKMIEREQLEAAIEVFEAVPEDDRLAAGRALAGALFERITLEFPGESWAEHSPENLVAAPDVCSLFPEAKIVHVVRDGRDRACSVVPLPFGADSFAEAVKRWALVLRRGDAVAKLLPPEQLMVLQLEDLVAFDRERSYERLREFLALPDDPVMRSFFETEVGPERAHVGRWRTELSDADRAELERVYDVTLAELRAEGVTCAPPDRTLELAFGPGEDRSSVDPWTEGGTDI